MDIATHVDIDIHIHIYIYMWIHRHGYGLADVGTWMKDYICVFPLALVWDWRTSCSNFLDSSVGAGVQKVRRAPWTKVL